MAKKVTPKKSTKKATSTKKVATKPRKKAAAKKYKTRKEWMIKGLASYAAAKKRKLLNNKQITGHFAKRTWPRYWTFERIKSSAKKYKTKKEWSIKDKLSYDAARERKLNKNKQITGHFTKTTWPSYWTYEKIKSGASLVQLYTSFVYEGPYVANKINEELEDLLMKDGFQSLKEAVGTDCI